MLGDGEGGVKPGENQIYQNVAVKLHEMDERSETDKIPKFFFNHLQISVV
jgi:hypothetical protein